MTFDPVYEFRVVVGRDGYFIADEEGDDVEPTRAYSTFAAAIARLGEIVREHQAAMAEEAQS